LVNPTKIDFKFFVKLRLNDNSTYIILKKRKTFKNFLNS
jgi:hypothetical protein